MTQPAQPIDWTRPLRTTTPGHHEVRVEGVNPREDLAIHVLIVETGERFVVDRAGRMASGAGPFVENVPPAPRIVERWMLVDQPADGVYLGIGRGLRSSREGCDNDRSDFTAGDDLRIARVLIEEPGR